MTQRIVAIVIGAALLGACDDSNPNERRVHDALVARIPQADIQAANECECFYVDYGYASEGACLLGEQAGAIPPSIDACVSSAAAGHGNLADYVECTLRATAGLSICLSQAQCTDTEFDACYAAATQAEDACAPYSPCYQLTGSALTQCQTDVSLFLSDIGACFQ